MPAVDLMKGIHRRATERFCGRRILFHHVPKCGGTSVGRAVRRAYILSQGTVKPRESELAFQAARDGPGGCANVHDLREMMLLYLLYDDCRCVAAHVPFSEAAFERFADRYAFFTLLRDPVQRFLSHYRWWHRPQREAPAPPPLGAFVESDAARWMGSSYVRYFCGDPGAARFTPRHVDAAIDTLHRLNFVGFLDELDGFEGALRDLTGRRITVGKENVGKGRSLDGVVDDEALLAGVREACAMDRDVWDGVQDLRGGKARPVGDVPEGPAAEPLSLAVAN